MTEVQDSADGRLLHGMQNEASTEHRASAGKCAGTSSMEGVIPPEFGVRVGPSALTRREFAMAAAALAMAPLARPAGAAETSASGNDDSEPEVPEPQDTGYEKGGLNIMKAYEDLTQASSYEPHGVYALPLGSTVLCDSEHRAAVIQSNLEAGSFTVVGCLDFQTGAYTVVVPVPVSGPSYAPTEARCTDSLIVWIEIDNATLDWVLYAAPFSGVPIDRDTYGLVALGSGNADWLPPQFSVWNNTVVWQVMPDPQGPHMREASHAWRWHLGAAEGVEVCASPGRFGCPPDISAGVLTIVPRVNPDEGVRYAMIALDLSDTSVELGRLVFPPSVRPFFATRIGEDFAFSIEANYGYGGLLGSMGYYLGPDADHLSYIPFEPYAQITYTGARYLVKSRLSYFVVDPYARQYGSLGSASGCTSYGDYPATSGTTGLFVTYATLKDPSTGLPSSVVVRTYTFMQE